MNNGNSSIKRILEIAAAILLAIMAFHVLGFLFSALITLIRVVLSLAVFGGVVALLDWALFRRNRITR